MNKTRIFLAALFAAATLGASTPGWGEDTGAAIERLSAEVNELKARVDAAESGDTPSWLTIGGDLRVRHDVLGGHTKAFTFFDMNTMTMTPMPAQKIENDSLLTNRFRLKLGAKVAEGVSLKARLVMQKAYGMGDSGPVTGGYFADRTMVFDGTSGHVASGNELYVDYAYADWSNIGGQPIWFSAGRRPSTGGTPTNLRRNEDSEGVSGVMGLLTDYAFDGFSLGAAPSISALPGFATKLCYGRAYQAGYRDEHSTLENTDMLGIVVIPLETDNTRIETQYQQGFNIMNTIPGPNVTVNLGEIEDYGIGVVHAFRKLGPGDLHAFAYGAMSKTDPNDQNVMGSGLLYTGTPKEREGYAAYVGARYDLPTGTKLGLEYNQGSRYWISFTPAADDVWTSKLGTRGNVVEGYVIQELPRFALAPKGKAFFRLGYQYYDFKYTYSNNWVGAPMRISDVTAATPQPLIPVKDAYDVYTTFEVHF